MAQFRSLCVGISVGLLLSTIATASPSVASTVKNGAVAGSTQPQQAQISKATAQKTLTDLKLHHTSAARQSLTPSEKADELSAPKGNHTEDEDDSGPAIVEGTADPDGDDSDSKSGFWFSTLPFISFSCSMIWLMVSRS